MNKLVELLNQYEREKEGLPEDFEDYVIWEVEGDDIIQGSADPDARKYFKYYIISKDYEFIKWLVDNDKIDKKKFEDEFFVCGCCGYKLLSTRETCEACGDEVLDVYEALLMRLAIQDEPIKFLLSIIK